MAFEVSSCTNFLDLRERISKFVSGIDSVQISSAGGTHTTTNLTDIALSSAPVSEAWTLTVANLAPVQFTVVGSVSGAQANAVLDTPYDNGIVKFKIQSITEIGTTNWSLGDTFSFSVATNAFNVTAEGWTVSRWGLAGTGGSSALGHILFKAPGKSTTDQIFMGIEAIQNLGVPYSNLRLTGFSGFDAQEPYNNQPGKSFNEYIPLHTTAMPYWLVANGSRMMVTAKIGTVYECGYLGFMSLPYGTPAQIPYPLVVAGTTGAQTLSYTSTINQHRSFSDPGNGMNFRCLDGVWRLHTNRDSSGNPVSDRCVWPLGGVGGNDQHNLWETVRDNIDGSYSLFPLILHSDDDSSDVYGELEGAYWVSGFNNFSENTAVIGPDTYVMFQNVFRTGVNEFWAMRLK